MRYIYVPSAGSSNLLIFNIITQREKLRTRSAMKVHNAGGRIPRVFDKSQEEENTQLHAQRLLLGGRVLDSLWMSG